MPLIKQWELSIFLPCMALRKLSFSISEVLKILDAAVNKVLARVLIFSKLAHLKKDNKLEKVHVSSGIRTHDRQWKLD